MSTSHYSTRQLCVHQFATSAPAPTRSFPVYFQDGEVVYPEFAYPLRKEIVPIYAAALIAFFVPFFFFALFSLRLRSVNSLLTTTMGLLKSLITAAVLQVERNASSITKSNTHLMLGVVEMAHWRSQTSLLRRLQAQYYTRLSAFRKRFCRHHV